MIRIYSCFCQLTTLARILGEKTPEIEMQFYLVTFPILGFEFGLTCVKGFEEHPYFVF